MRSCGVSEELIRSGHIRLESYTEDLLETSGYMLTGDESAYVIRNNRKFNFDFCTADEAAQISTPDNTSLDSKTVAQEQAGMTGPAM